MNELLLFLAILGPIVGVVGGMAGTWAAIRPDIQRRQEEDARNQAVHEALLGEGEQRDLSGQVIRPSRPGLVALHEQSAKRLEKVEEAVVEFRTATDLFARLEPRIATVEDEIRLIKSDRFRELIQLFDRIATSAASAEAMRLVSTERENPPGDPQ